MFLKSLIIGVSSKGSFIISMRGRSKVMPNNVKISSKVNKANLAWKKLVLSKQSRQFVLKTPDCL